MSDTERTVLIRNWHHCAGYVWMVLFNIHLMMFLCRTLNRRYWYGTGTTVPDMCEWFYLIYIWWCFYVGHWTDGTDTELTRHWFVWIDLLRPRIEKKNAFMRDAVCAEERLTVTTYCSSSVARFSTRGVIPQSGSATYSDCNLIRDTSPHTFQFASWYSVALRASRLVSTCMGPFTMAQRTSDGWVLARTLRNQFLN
jgi:hypothetical protein